MKAFFRKALDWDHSDFPALIKFIAQALAFASTVLVTIWLAPAINRDFAKEERRTSFYLSTLEALNNDTKELLADVTIYIDGSYHDENREQLRSKIRRSGTKLYWRRVEFALVFQEAEFDRALTEYSESLLTLMELLSVPSNELDEAKVRAALEAFGLRTARVIEYLAGKVNV